MKCISCISDENKSHKQHTADKDSLTWQLVVSIRRRKSSIVFGTLQVLCKSRGSSVVLAVLNRICHDFQTMPEITWKTFEHVPTTAYKVSLLTFTWHQTKTFDRPLGSPVPVQYSRLFSRKFEREDRSKFSYSLKVVPWQLHLNLRIFVRFRVKVTLVSHML